MRLRLLIMVSVIFLTNGCSNMTTEDFAGSKPEFLIERYFSGTTKAWGIFEDRFGRLRRSFTVDIVGEWDGEALTLTEDFLYDDGETERRVWRIRKLADGRYEGRAGDVVGVAEGRAAGRALNWRYTLALKVGDSTWNVRFDDWMFLQDGDVVINRARVSKFGFTIGEVTLFFRKPGAADARTAVTPRLRAAS